LSILLIQFKKIDKTKIDLIVEKYKQQAKEIRVVAYNMLIEKFNQKYSSLSDNQRCLLKKYIDSMSNVTALKEYVGSEVPRVSKLLTSYIPKIDLKLLN